MIIRKTIAVISVFALLITSLSSCGYELVLRKKGEDNSTEYNDSAVTGESEPSQNTVPSSPSSGDIQFQPTDPSGEDDPISSAFHAMPMSSQDVLELYRRAMNDVKVRAPGYLRYEYQETSDVTAGDGNLQLMNNILNLVAKELLKDSGDEAASIQISAHDDIAVRKTFPLYEKDVGCELTTMSIIKSAVCYSDGKTYRIVIQLDDQLNPHHETSDFAKIMTPIDRESLSDPIEEYLVVLDKNQYKFDINYTGCEITCTIDAETARMTSLTQKMIMDIEINMNLDLIIFETSSVKANGRIVNILKYTNFDWS